MEERQLTLVTLHQPIDKLVLLITIPNLNTKLIENRKANFT